MLIVFIHGFLGTSQDWQEVIKYIPSSIECECIELFSVNKKNKEIMTFNEWAENFNEYFRSVPKKYPKKILVGYSLGGRLALQALMQTKNPWDQAVILSANPGCFESQEKRVQRQITDEQWARKFEQEPWNQVMDLWDNQLALKDSGRITRYEKNYSKKRLSNALRNWSLSEQYISLSQLNSLSIPLYWAAGSRDIKYLKLMEELKKKMNRNNTFHEFNEAGHRLIFDQPKAVSEYILSSCSI